MYTPPLSLSVVIVSQSFFIVNKNDVNGKKTVVSGKINEESGDFNTF